MGRCSVMQERTVLIEIGQMVDTFEHNESINYSALMNDLVKLREKYRKFIL